MKILSSQQIKEADKYTIENEPISSLDLMERAANQLQLWLTEHLVINNTTEFTIFCGIGNNGGDGLVIAKKLLEKQLNVNLYIVAFSKKYSPDFQYYLDILKKETNIVPVFLNQENTAVKLKNTSIIIDAIFGSGLTRPADGFVAEIIEKMNASGRKIISIDIPSGLFTDVCYTDNTSAIIKADKTITIQQPKLAFLFPENEQYVGDFDVVDIQIHPQYLYEAETPYFYTTFDEVKKIVFPTRRKFSHKGTFGHTLIVAGSKGKIGAAVLSSKAALKTGSGLVTALVPLVGLNVLQTTTPEVMCIPSSQENYINELPDLSPFNSIAVGPGLGMEKQTQNTLKLLIQNAQQPLVLDADALNILAENKTWLSFLPHYSVLTPHPKEFERLFGKTSNSEDRLKLLRENAIKHQIIIVLKGANTAIALPSGEVHFNSSGNPGMATAGSGDVLTGIIASLLAQGYTATAAAIIGVYLHGFAGDSAKKESHEISTIASDIIANIPQFYNAVKEKWFN